MLGRDHLGVSRTEGDGGKRMARHRAMVANRLGLSQTYGQAAIPVRAGSHSSSQNT